jgi:hypothetical protein
MTELERAKIIHEKAMALSHEADMAKIWHDESKAQILYRQSFDLEREVAYIYSERFDKEPIRSTMYSSAASLAMLCHLYEEANLLIEQGLSSSTPPRMVKELHELKELVQQQKMQHLAQLVNTEAEQPFWISGVLRRADADKNTIKLASNGTEPKSQPHYYTINVVSETLNKLVKNNWGDIINVYIKPKSKKGKQHQYELIEVS